MANSINKADAWSSLRSFTNARIALGRTGSAIPVAESMAFKLAHAEARDAVYSLLDVSWLENALAKFHLPFYLLQTQAKDRMEYLQRPDLGRALDVESSRHLASDSGGYDIAIIIGDGLSASAVNAHACTLIELIVPLLLEKGLSVAPVILLQQARVAAGDEIGELLNAKLTVMLIGERPGLSSPDSMGAYLTYAPKKGLTDESRNCISNIRTEGLGYKQACEKLFYFINESLRLKISGIAIKDTTALLHT